MRSFSAFSAASFSAFSAALRSFSAAFSAALRSFSAFAAASFSAFAAFTAAFTTFFMAGSSLPSRSAALFFAARRHRSAGDFFSVLAPASDGSALDLPKALPSRLKSLVSASVSEIGPPSASSCARRTETDAPRSRPPLADGRAAASASPLLPLRAWPCALAAAGGGLAF